MITLLFECFDNLHNKRNEYRSTSVVVVMDNLYFICWKV